MEKTIRLEGAWFVIDNYAICGNEILRKGIKP